MAPAILSWKKTKFFSGLKIAGARVPPITTFRRLSVFTVSFTGSFASTCADNETFCTVLLTSQVVLVQSLQPKGHEFESE